MEVKKQEVALLSERLSGACAGVLVDYRGIGVADDTALRTELRKAGVKYTVTKNTMLKLATKGTKLQNLDKYLDSTTAIATSTDDYVAAARILCKYADTHKNFTVKSGFIDTEVIDSVKVQSLAKLPSREVLLSMVCNVFNAPIAAFARAIQAVADKNGAPAPAKADVAAENTVPAEEPQAPAAEETSAEQA